MSTGEEPDQQLASAVAARQQAEALRRRLDTATQHARETAEASRQAQSMLAGEQADLDALEHLSWSRILSTLKGSHATDLEREQAERDAARYRAGVAEAADRTAQAEVSSLQTQLASLGDTEEQYAEALAGKESWTQVHDPATATRLDEIAHRRGELAAEDREAREAFAAGTAAQQHLSSAARLLDSARSWSAWDTFGGGDFISSMVKHQRLDSVADELRRADAALQSFGRELADLSLDGVATVNITPLMRTFDVWFDNIFTDLAVRRRIIEAQEQVAATSRRVGEVLQDLQRRGQQIAQELAALDAERERLLVG
jgi:hypothetical protein